jgi:type I restriction enzyme R subunit
MSGVVENHVEQAAILWFERQGYRYLHGPDIAPGEPDAERASYADVVLVGRLRAALERLNPHLPSDAVDEAVRRLTRPESASLEENNRAFRRHLVRGVPVEVRVDGETRGERAWAVDFDDPDRNDWVVVNQLTVIEGGHRRRPDLVVYVNGLPLAVVELKSPTDERATLRHAWNQIQTYKAEVPSLFHTNEAVVISDGRAARVGSLTAPFERFGPWRTEDDDAPGLRGNELRVVIGDLFERSAFLDYVRAFQFWEADPLAPAGAIKKAAAYHQFHAVRKAVGAVAEAARVEGDRRAGVVWHTQGSGKSVSMVFLAGELVRHPGLENPTLVVLTDRNDLDDQLFGQFAAATTLVPAPVQAESRDHLRELLRVASGGVVFTTIQKFGTRQGERMPELSARRNVVVMADEAHRSQYEFVEGLARNLRDALPGATFVGFTGTPIDQEDRSTVAVFGDVIDAYTIGQAVEDKATVPIYYEARLAKIDLPEDERPRVDAEFEEVTEDEEDTTRARLSATWARLEAMVGLKKRLRLVAEDLVEHFERRQEIVEGKAFVVCMSRRVCADLYREIVRLRPDWHSDADDEGSVKAVMTGSAADPAALQPHVRSKDALKTIERRFKDPDDPLRMVLVRDMWLTGFDVPPAHTIYVDKPMKGHTLMQAVARVNRVWRDKPSGLVVDYLGVAEELRKAVGTYGGRRGERPGVPVEEALLVLQEKVDVVRAMFHGFDYDGYFSGDPAEQVEALSAGADHVLGLDDGRDRFLEATAQMNKAAGIAVHLEEARGLRDDVAYFQAVRKTIRKYGAGSGGSGRSSEELGAAIRQIVSSAVHSDGVVDLFGEAGLDRPDLSILSEEFLATVRESPHKNLQIEALRKLLQGEIRAQERRNVVQARRFSDMLAQTITGYQNRSLEAAEVVLELIEMARQIREAPKRGEALGLTDDELAFYDALADHGGVREVMGDRVLGTIAHDLVEAVRASVSIDWTQKEAVRAKMRARVKRLLRRHGYPPEQAEAAVATVIEQAEHVARDWATAA